MIQRIKRRLFGKKVKFVLIGTQRSGTTLLTEYLASHPDVYMGRELFKMTGEGLNVDADGYRDVEMPVEAYLDAYYARRSKGVLACGFKVMADQLQQFPEITAYLRRHGVLCLYLKRINVVETALSRLLARQRNVYHIDRETAFSPEKIDVQALLNEVYRIEETYEYLRQTAADLPAKTLFYEALVKQKQPAMDDVSDFLGVKRTTGLSSRLQKINSKDWPDVISNYDEVHAALSAAGYRRFIEKPEIYRPFNDADKVIFIHVPKAAGSSIEKALFSTRGEVGHHGAEEYLLADAEKFRRYFTFAFVRNPLDRFVSAYEYLAQGGRNRFDEAWMRQQIEPYPGFKSFVMRLKDPSQRKTILAWMHFKPQHRFVCDDTDKIMVDFLGKYENIEQDFATVASHLGLNNTLPHENATANRRDYRTYYDEETRQVIEEVYKLDFEIFHYSLD